MSDGDELPEEVRALLDAERARPPLSADAVHAARARFEAERLLAPPTFPWARSAAAGASLAAAFGAGLVVGSIATTALRPPRTVLREVRQELPAVGDAGAAVDAPGVDAPGVDAPAVDAPAVDASAVDAGERSREAPRLVLSPAAADGLARERLVLQRARSALLRRDAIAALEGVRLHARAFADGALLEEREALRVEALAALGRVDEARARAGDFHRRWPTSLFAERVTRAVRE